MQSADLTTTDMTNEQRNKRYLTTLARVADRLDSFAGLFKPCGESKLIKQLHDEAAELRNYAMYKPHGSKPWRASKS